METNGQPKLRGTSKRKRRVQTRAQKSPLESSSWTAATLSKATIQKTVRFNPQLIARWEQLAQSTRENGGIPASFQQVQNEALEMWLSKNDM
jgi:hypothetical protein